MYLSPVVNRVHYLYYLKNKRPVRRLVSKPLNFGDIMLRNHLGLSSFVRTVLTSALYPRDRFRSRSLVRANLHLLRVISRNLIYPTRLVCASVIVTKNAYASHIQLLISSSYFDNVFSFPFFYRPTYKTQR